MKANTESGRISPYLVPRDFSKRNPRDFTLEIAVRFLRASRGNCHTVMKNHEPKIALRKIYAKLFKKFGPQHWWPARTKFEVIVGAILTQNTNWGNVEKAIQRLKAAAALY